MPEGLAELVLNGENVQLEFKGSSRSLCLESVLLTGKFVQLQWLSGLH
jgi:hypothetical protein